MRNRRFSAGEKYRPAAVSEQLDPRHVSPEQIHQCLAQNEDRSPLANLKHSIRSFNETMTREALSRSGVPPSDLCRLEPVQAEKLASAISEIAGRFLGGGSAYLYEIRGKVEIYPFKLRSVDTAPEKFRTLSLATMEMVNRRHSTAEDADKEKQALKAVARAIRRRDRLILNLQQDIDQASEYEQYRRYAELLQLNRDRLQKGMNRIEVEDILADPTRMVEILLDPAATPNENIESYFRRNRKGREGLDILKRRLEIVNTELTSLKNMLAELDTDFETAQKKYRSELAALMPREAARRAEPPRLPYRAATLSTGATVLIGRGGADNDRTTFEFARPYELWFHAQQCAGSHVVLKFPGKSFEPSRQEIEETAAIAAYHSKARNDSLVPVAYTVRKHVRKPRKAKPGLVILEHEKSVMVAPKKETGARER